MTRFKRPQFTTLTKVNTHQFYQKIKVLNGMYFSKGPNFLLVWGQNFASLGSKFCQWGSNYEIKLVSKLILVRCQIFVYLGIKL
jgi:hypothetical protein